MLRYQVPAGGSAEPQPAQAEPDRPGPAARPRDHRVGRRHDRGPTRRRYPVEALREQGYDAIFVSACARAGYPPETPADDETRMEAEPPRRRARRMMASWPRATASSSGGVGVRARVGGRGDRARPRGGPGHRPATSAAAATSRSSSRRPRSRASCHRSRSRPASGSAPSAEAPAGARQMPATRRRTRSRRRAAACAATCGR